MSAVHIAESAAAVVIISKKESRVTGIAGVFAERVVDRSECPPQIVDRDRTLTSQVGLQIGHEQGARHSFARDISQHQRQVAFTELYKIVVVPAHCPSWDAAACILERLH